MLSITELSPVRVTEFKRAIRSSEREARVARQLMLDLLAKAYEVDIEEEYIPYYYFDRANDILSFATDVGMRDALYKAIMKKEGLI